MARSRRSRSIAPRSRPCGRRVPTPRASPITPKPLETSRRCSSSRPQPQRARPRQAPTGRPSVSTRERFASAGGSTRAPRRPARARRPRVLPRRPLRRGREVARGGNRDPNASGDRLREGDALRQLSSVQRCGALTAEGAETGRQAVALLEKCPPGRELAAAYANLAMVALNAHDLDAATSAGERGLELAEEFGYTEFVAHTLNTLGTRELIERKAEGREKLERSLPARAGGGTRGAHRQRVHPLCRCRAAEPRLRARRPLHRPRDGVLQRARPRPLGPLHARLQRTDRAGPRALGRCDRGDSGECRRPGIPLPRIVALVVLGLAHARRGEPDHWPALDEAAELSAD